MRTGRGRDRRAQRGERGGIVIGKALKTILTTLLIAVISLAGMAWLLCGANRRLDADPNTILERKLMPFLKDGAYLDLTEPFPEAWDSVQVVHGAQALTDSEWRALCAFDGAFSRLGGQQALVFWRDGEIARAIRFEPKAEGMPWFVEEGEDSFVLGRDAALFLVQRATEDGRAYYVCTPTEKVAL